MRRQRRQRGTTLIEIMISMGIVLVGMLAMFGVLRSAIGGSATASRMSQAQLRAQTIIESIRNSPKQALTCLYTTSAASWDNCVAVCKQQLTVQTWDACVYSLTALKHLPAPDTSGVNQFDTNNGQANDRNGMSYFIESDQTRSPSGYSRVDIAGANSALFDVRVTVAWYDDAQAQPPSGYHSVTLRTGVFPIQ